MYKLRKKACKADELSKLITSVLFYVAFTYTATLSASYVEQICLFMRQAVQ